MYPLAVLSHVQPRLTYNPMLNTSHDFSKATGMCGAKAGDSPPRRSPAGTLVEL